MFNESDNIGKLRRLLRVAAPLSVPPPPPTSSL